MYRLQILRAGVWTVLDERDDEVFQGTLSACESWLDRQENQAASAGLPARGRGGLRLWFLRWWKPRPPMVPHLPAVARSAASSQLPQRP